MDWTSAVYWRTDSPAEENVSMWGHWFLAEGGRWAWSVLCSFARLPDLLLLEEEQKVWFLFLEIYNLLFLVYANKLRASLSLCSDRLEYKYSKLVMSANKECELPAADSCAIMEGEENEEEEVVYANKSSLLAKLKAIAKVS